MPDADGTVLGCFVTLGALCAAPAEGDKAETHLRLSGKGTAHVFISDARGELTCYDKTFSWQPGRPVVRCGRCRLAKRGGVRRAGLQQ